MRATLSRCAVLSLVLVGVLQASAAACSVPVFRYALERWRTDAYYAVVFHRGKFTDAQTKLLHRATSRGKGQQAAANVQVKPVDLDALESGKLPGARELAVLWESQQKHKPTLPWVALLYPKPMAPAWSGPLTRANVEALVDSPARREITKRILAGDTAVWVLLESGVKADDAKSHDTLAKRLKHEEKNLKLPPIDPKDIAAGLASPEALKLKIRFSTIRISRTDPKEAVFVQMLQGSEGSGKDSLRDPQYARQTMAFPIFGRGRVLYGLVGAGIANDTIHETCQTLIGPCTCQVKDDNPGVDLVTSVDWDQHVAPQIPEKPLPPLGGLGSFIKKPTKKSAPSKKPTAPAKSAPSKTPSPEK